MHDVAFRDRAAYFEAVDVLVVADTHVGRGEASSVEFPLGERSDLRERLDELVDHFDPDRTVFAGDVLHTFDHVSEAAIDGLHELTDVCRAAGSQPVLIAGNHDTVLADVWPDPVHDEYSLGDGTVVCHGHERPDHDADRYVVGHDHPTITVEGDRHPCFLYGTDVYRGADVLMLPAFNRLAPGVEVNGMRSRNFQSPFVTDADALRPLVVDEDAGEVLEFPPLGEFRGML